MNTWQYKVTDIHPEADLESVMNDWGRGGWELVAVTIEPGSRKLYFKRELV